MFCFQELFAEDYATAMDITADLDGNSVDTAGQFCATIGSAVPYYGVESCFLAAFKEAAHHLATYIVDLDGHSCILIQHVVDAGGRIEGVGIDLFDTTDRGYDSRSTGLAVDHCGNHRTVELAGAVHINVFKPIVIGTVSLDFLIYKSVVLGN